jgi:hypothetical protein
MVQCLQPEFYTSECLRANGDEKTRLRPSVSGLKCRARDRNPKTQDKFVRAISHRLRQHIGLSVLAGEHRVRFRVAQEAFLSRVELERSPGGICDVGQMGQR